MSTSRDIYSEIKQALNRNRNREAKAQIFILPKIKICEALPN